MTWIQNLEVKTKPRKADAKMGSESLGRLKQFPNLVVTTSFGHYALAKSPS